MAEPNQWGDFRFTINSITVGPQRCPFVSADALWPSFLPDCLPIGRMVRCLRCPVAYHSVDACIAAGSTLVSSCVLICSNHSTRSSSSSSAVNVGFCVVCARGESQSFLFRSFWVRWCISPLKSSSRSTPKRDEHFQQPVPFVTLDTQTVKILILS